LVLLANFLKDGLINEDFSLSNERSSLLLRFNKVIPRVLPNIGYSVTLLRVNDKDLFHHVLKSVRESWRHGILRGLDLLIELGSVLVLKRQIASDHGKENHSATPDIRHQAMISVAFDHLRSRVTWTSTSSFKHLSLHVEVTETEVNKLNVVVVVKKNILGLKISMNDSNLVNIFNARYYLLIVLASLIFLQTFRFSDLLKQLIPTAIFHY
jgi:hypothetical protein